MRALLVLLGGLCLPACIIVIDKGGGDGDGTTTTTWEDDVYDTDVETRPDTGYVNPGGPDQPVPQFTASWEQNTLVVTITGGVGNYTLGIAESDPSSAAPWTGEDCYNGFVNPDGTILLYCHPLTSTGGQFTGGGNPYYLNEDIETVFTPALADMMTFAAWNGDMSACWTWGANPDYYAGAGCQVQ